MLGSADLQNLRGVLADDPLRAVQVLPGVVSGDDLRSDFSVRASPFSHINMTVDGFSTPYILHTVRAVEDYSASGSVAMINSDILQDVALLSGGYPQRFGNRTGAEIDFRLREGSRDRTHALVCGQRHQRVGGLRRPDRHQPARLVAAVGEAELHRSDHQADRSGACVSASATRRPSWHST